MVFFADDGKDFSEIPGENKKKYMISEDMLGKYIKSSGDTFMRLCRRTVRRLYRNQAEKSKKMFIPLQNLMKNHSFEEVKQAGS